MKSNALWKIYVFTVLLGMLLSFNAWFLYGINVYLANLLLTVWGILSIMVMPGKFSSDFYYKRWFFLLFVAVLLTTIHKNFYGLLGAILTILPLYSVFCLSPQSKCELLKFIVKCFGWLFLLSSIGWTFHLLKMDLPYTLFTVGDGEVKDYQYLYENHFLYLVNITFKKNDLISFLIDRFTCVFLEPGYTGCLLSILLYIGRYKFDKTCWYNYVFLYSLILTFSLAGWGISLFGYFMYKTKTSKRKMLYYFSFICILLFVYIFAVNYNDGDNMLNYAFFKRLSEGEDGGIAWNRGTNVEHFFYNKFLPSGEKWFGTERLDVFNANDVDWKSYIVDNGIIGFGAYLLFLYYPLVGRKPKLFGFFVFATMFFMNFIQTSGSAFYMMYLCLIVLAENRIIADYKI